MNIYKIYEDLELAMWDGDWNEYNRLVSLLVGVVNDH